MAREGPPQPPELRKMRMGVGSLPWKYSFICTFAGSVKLIIVKLSLFIYLFFRVILSLNNLILIIPFQHVNVLVYIFL